MSHITEPVLLDGIMSISHQLDIDRTTADDLVKAGVLGQWYSIDGRTATAAGAVRQLLDVPYFDPTDPETPRALVVKVKPAFAVEDEDRNYQGWHADLSPKDQADGIRGWWSVRDVEEWVNHLLVATIGGFVVGVWRITDFETQFGKLHRFAITAVGTEDPEAVKFIGKRMAPVPGGVTLRLPLQTSN